MVNAEQPRILELRTGEKAWTAGSWSMLYIRPTDDVSGIEVSQIKCNGIESVPVDNASPHFTRECRNLRHETGDWYSIEVHVSEFLPDGEYFLWNIDVRNRAGHGFSLHTEYPYDGRYCAYREGINNCGGQCK